MGRSCSSPMRPMPRLASFTRTREEVPGQRDGVSAIVVETGPGGISALAPLADHRCRPRHHGTEPVGGEGAGYQLARPGWRTGQSFANESRSLRRRLFTAAHLTGVASAAQDMCRSAVWSRREHGKPLAQGERARLALADGEIGIAASRALYVAAADEVDEMALTATAFANEIAGSVVGRTMDLHGPAGGSADLPLERWARELRWQRLSSGGLDQQRMAVAQRLVSTFKK